MKQKKFVTLFDRTENFHLIKDVGQIPYHLLKEFNYDSKIVTCRNSDNYEYLEKEVKGLKIEFIPKIKFFKFNFAIIIYLFKHAKEIDILNQFHIRYYTLIYSFIYKLMNKKGISYIKADISEKHLNTHGLILKRRIFKHITIFETVIFYLTNKYIDVISIETKDGVDIVKDKYNFLSKKIFYIPNGVDSDYINNLNFNDSESGNKKNIILYVARIGSYPKNTELFLEAMEKINLFDWEVHLVGEINKGFEAYVEDFFKRNSSLKSKVIFHGNITSREEIYKYYSSSKIFCLTSLWEGFPLVFPEAIYFGNYIVSTDVSAVKDITANGKYGIVSQDFTSESYSKLLSELISSSTVNDELCEHIKRYAKENFTWQLIIKNLHNILNSIK